MASEDTLAIVMTAAREVFQQQVGTDQNFFDLNGNSQQAVSLVLRIEESLGREIDLSWLLDAGSFGEFSTLIGE
jgi:acyl carrier protein